MSEIYPVQLMIAGAQKGGTSSLNEYLSQHPCICTHQQIEMMYFSVDSIYAQGYERAYERYFSHKRNQHKVILAKNVAIMYMPLAAQRLYNHNPSVQVVVILRHPVERAYSAYWFARRMGWEDISRFEYAIGADPSRFKNDPVRLRNCAYLDRSLYAKHLHNLFTIFSKQQVHIYLLEDIKANPIAVCQSLFKQIEIDDSFIPRTERKKNTAAFPKYEQINWVMSSNHPLPATLRKTVRTLLPDRLGDRLKIRVRQSNERDFLPPKMDQETRQELLDYFRPHNEELSSLLDRDLSSWLH